MARALSAFLLLLTLGTPVWLATAVRTAPHPQVSVNPNGSLNQQSFAEWLDGVRTEALARGFGADLVERVFRQIEPLSAVVDRDRNQAESTLSIEEYIARRVTPAVVRTGRDMARRHGALLRQVEAAHGVQGRFVLAVWGLESSFGRVSGSYLTIAALATLAYDPRRSGLFRTELFEALSILESGDVDLDRMQGSWAGAMGQPQFMPSSYLQYAVDFDGDGRRDIWATPADVFGSIANYLGEHGWIRRTIWGREVRVSEAGAERAARAAPQRTEGCRAMRQMSEPLPLARWHELDVTRPGGDRLPQASLDASLVRTDRRVLLVYDNYEALLQYNCSHAYALSVASLADRIAGAG